MKLAQHYSVCFLRWANKWARNYYLWLFDTAERAGHCISANTAATMVWRRCVERRTCISNGWARKAAKRRRFPGRSVYRVSALRCVPPAAGVLAWQNSHIRSRHNTPRRLTALGSGVNPSTSVATGRRRRRSSSSCTSCWSRRRRLHDFTPTEVAARQWSQGYRAGVQLDSDQPSTRSVPLIRVTTAADGQITSPAMVGCFNSNRTHLLTCLLTQFIFIHHWNSSRSKQINWKQ